MGDDLWNFEEDDLGEDATDAAGPYKSASKDCTVLVVDAAEAMFVGESARRQDGCFRLALEVRSLLLRVVYCRAPSSPFAF